ncbi:MAG: carboxypeptidase regulatory-like domain-containing protein [Candidatus Margulisbacteria bacterium]|nr:carboxypeptidase regulatory-like domain-containing protein [Candidatus Margulisiibacteriota bacterium]
MANFFNYLRFSLLGGLLLVLVVIFGCGDISSGVSSLTISPSPVTVGINQPQAFTVLGINSLGQIVSVTPTWSVTGSIGTVNSNGVFIAGAATGSGTVVATYDDKSASASITVTDKCWVEGKITGELDAGGVQSILVSVSGTSYSDRSDSNGNYSISNVPAGTYHVYTEENNQIYQSVSSEVTVTAGQTKTQNFYLTVRPGVPIPSTTTIPDFF